MTRIPQYEPIAQSIPTGEFVRAQILVWTLPESYADNSRMPCDGAEMCEDWSKPSDLDFRSAAV